MGQLLFVRHSITPWNQQKKIQGHTDIELAPEGIAEIKRWMSPSTLPFKIDAVHCSPLKRAQQTVRLWGFDEINLASALIEMNWGEWEGKHLSDLKEQLGQAFSDNENQGIHFLPPGGESPYDVSIRLQDFLKTLPTQGAQLIICHKGVMRAAMILATQWSMIGKAPYKVKANTGHLYQWDGKQLVIEDADFNLVVND